MCLLTFAPSGVVIDDDRLFEASLNNPDGFGFSIRTPQRIVRARGMHFEQVLAEYHKALRTHGHGESMFHLRWATHGSTNKANCHPFYVGSDRDSMLGHNGVIPINIPKGDSRSDTRYFSEVMLPKRGGVSKLDDPKFVKDISKSIGSSKLVILTNNPSARKNFYIINEDMGHWDSDVWWSNYSYRPYTMSTQKSPSYYSASTVIDDSDDLDYWTWVTECPVCCVDIVCNEAKGETTCPSCDTCLLCENNANFCDCYGHDTIDEWRSTADEWREHHQSVDSLIPYSSFEYF